MTQLIDSSPRTDISSFSGKDTLLRVLQAEYDGTIAMLLAADDEQWQRETPCEEWQVRDLAGHLLDVAESYLGYFRTAREGYPTEAPRGMRCYAHELGGAGLAFRSLSRHELIARLQAFSDELFGQFRELDEQGWTSPIPHKYVGPVPAFMMVTFQLMDYAVHTWDFQKALGKPTQINPEAADILVPYMFGLKAICFDDEAKALDVSLNEVNLEVQVDIAGRSDDSWTVTVKDGSYSFAPGPASNPQAIVSYPDPAEFALDAYQRFAGGEATGDERAIAQFRSLFFTI
jgi:uncharacterized protein (TIGR03083 family)